MQRNQETKVKRFSDTVTEEEIQELMEMKKENAMDHFIECMKGGGGFSTKVKELIYQSWNAVCSADSSNQITLSEMSVVELVRLAGANDILSKTYMETFERAMRPVSRHLLEMEVRLRRGGRIQ